MIFQAVKTVSAASPLNCSVNCCVYLFTLQYAGMVNLYGDVANMHFLADLVACS